MVPNDIEGVHALLLGDLLAVNCDDRVVCAQASSLGRRVGPHILHPDARRDGAGVHTHFNGNTRADVVHPRNAVDNRGRREQTS